MGYCLLISIGYHFLYVHRPLTTATMMMIVVLFSVAQSNLRAFDYESEYTLYYSGIQVNPNNAKIYYNLAKISLDNADYEKAFIFGQRANLLWPRNLGTLNNLANACRGLNKHAIAIDYYIEALQLE